MNKCVKLFSNVLVLLLSILTFDVLSKCSQEQSLPFENIGKGLGYAAVRTFKSLLPNPHNNLEKSAAVVPLMVHPYLGAYMSDGSFALPPFIELKKIRELIFRPNFLTGSFYTEEYPVYRDTASGHPDPNKLLFHFESLLFDAWKRWYKEHALPANVIYQNKLRESTRIKSGYGFSKILQSDGLFTLKNCQQQPVFKPTSIGYALLSVIANYVQQLGLDPNTLSIKELMAIGAGHEQRFTLVSLDQSEQINSAYYQLQDDADRQRIEQSLILQAALLYAHKRQLLDLNQSLSLSQINTSIKQFRRHYQASILHMRALSLFKQAKNVQPIPTIESVAKSELLKVGLNPEMRVGIKIGFIPACRNRQNLSSCTDLLWKFYARVHNWTGEHNSLVYPDFNYADIEDSSAAKKRYQRLPELKDAFRSAIKRLSDSKEYSKYKRALALLFKSNLYLRDDLKEEVLDIILNDQYAHNINMAYYGVADQALIYFDATKGNASPYSIVKIDKDIEVKSFNNLKQLKNWLKKSESQFYFRKLFSQIPDRIWNDSVPKYFDEFVYGDNWTWRWNSAFWEKAIDFTPMGAENPFELVLSRELSSYVHKSLEHIMSVQDLWLEDLHQLISFIPFVGQPIDMVWNLAEGNAEGAIIDVAFIATELPDDIGIAMSILKRSSAALRSAGEMSMVDGLNEERLLDFYDAGSLAKKNKQSFLLSETSSNSIEKASNTLVSSESRSSMSIASPLASLEEGHYMAYDVQGKKQHYVRFQSELIQVEPDQNTLNLFHPVSKEYVPHLFKSVPETDVVYKENQFEDDFSSHSSQQEQVVMWQHPVTGDELRVVQMQHTGQMTAIKYDQSGLLQPVDFKTGKILPDQDSIVERKSASRVQYEYQPLKGEGVFAVTARREAKREVIDMLMKIIEIGNRGGSQLSSDQRVEIHYLLSELLDRQRDRVMGHSGMHVATPVHQTLIDSILKTAKGFNVLPAQELFADFKNINTMYDYLRKLYKHINSCQLYHINDIGVWVREFVANQKGVRLHGAFSESAAENLVSRVNKLEMLERLRSRSPSPLPEDVGFPRQLGSLPVEGHAKVYYVPSRVSDEVFSMTIPLNNQRPLTQQLLDYFEPLDDGVYGYLPEETTLDPNGERKKNLFDITQVSVIDDDTLKIKRLFFPRKKPRQFHFYNRLYDSVPVDAEHIEHLVTPLQFDSITSGRYFLRYTKFKGLHVVQQGTGSSCGATALYMVLKDYGIESNLGVMIKESQSGIFIDELYRWAKKESQDLGVYMEEASNNVLKTVRKRLSPSGPAKAAIVNYDGHFIVIDWFKNHHVFIRDPYMGTLSKVPVNELLPNVFGKSVLYFPK